ncbi:MAG: nucleotidyltransferase domain-containing protein [Planctomycetaceae bacterium]|nr:nucleotidyltransferase domain-containing protein [Planctomycetaceae bacterium]
MVSFDKSVLNKCKTAVQKIVPDADIILFGSRARGQAEELSDYDLLILVNQKSDVSLNERILDEIYPIELDTDAMISFVVQSRDIWNSPLSRATPFHKNIDREGIAV